MAGEINFTSYQPAINTLNVPVAMLPGDLYLYTIDSEGALRKFSCFLEIAFNWLRHVFGCYSNKDAAQALQKKLVKVIESKNIHLQEDADYRGAAEKFTYLATLSVRTAQPELETALSNAGERAPLPAPIEPTGPSPTARRISVVATNPTGIAPPMQPKLEKPPEGDLPAPIAPAVPSYPAIRRISEVVATTPKVITAPIQPKLETAPENADQPVSTEPAVPAPTSPKAVEVVTVPEITVPQLVTTVQEAFTVLKMIPDLNTSKLNGAQQALLNLTEWKEENHTETDSKFIIYFANLALHNKGTYDAVTSLSIAGSTISTLPTILVSLFPNITTMALKVTRFSDGSLLSSFKQLTQLSIKGDIKSRKFPALQLPSLTYLEIECPLDAMPNFKDCPQITTLVLKIGTKSTAGISVLTNLENLDLSDNRITDLKVDDINPNKLRQLNLSGNPITALPSSIKKLKNLENLNLGETQLQMVPQSLLEHQTLKMVYLPAYLSGGSYIFKKARVMYIGLDQLSHEQHLRLAIANRRGGVHGESTLLNDFD